jgi:natural product biosynthesis luciferase-like monooxygenase protein/amino acid adenylation domain-containing protein/FkbM family methyltransferase
MSEQVIMSETSTLTPELLPDERDLLQELIAEEGSRFNVFPLSFAQRRLWFLEQLDPGTGRYNIASAVEIRGPLRADLLERSLAEVVRRHEILRTSFLALDGEPVQIVSSEVELSLPVQTVDSMEEARRLASEEALAPFDLEKAPLLRARLLAYSPEHHLLLLTLHHIVSDGWSAGILVREIGEIYRALTEGSPIPLPELAIQYADFAVWQAEWLQGEVLEEQLSYWRRQLAGLEPLELPTDRPRPARRGHRGGQVPVALGRELSAGLEALARQEGTTPFAAVLAAFQVLLHRYTGRVDVAVGSPIANRNRSEIEDLIGFFANTLVLRAHLGGDPSFRQLLRQVGETVLEAYAYQDVPFEKLVEELEPDRNLGRSPLFQVLLVFQNAPQPELALPGLRLRLLPAEAGAAKFDLTLSLAPGDGGFAGYLEYDADLFEAATVERMAVHLRTLVEGIVRSPEARLSDLPLLAGAEEDLLRQWGTGAGWSVEPRCIHELFEEQAARTPDAPALAFEETRVTYRELNERANRLARHLRKMGVGPDVPVGLCLERSAEMIEGVLGILKAGGAYVPMDPSFPAERRKAMLRDAGAEVLITAGTFEREALAGYSAENPASEVEPGNLAYVIYTSGSTGRPKGVAVEHRQLHAYLAGILPLLGLPPGADYATVSTLAADLGNTTVFAALCGGGCLHVLSEHRIMDAEALADHLERHPVDALKIVPSHLQALLSCERPERVLPRRRLVLGGEAASWPLIDRVRSLAPDCVILNHYGPTETTVGAVSHVLEAGAPRLSAAPALGRPLAGSSILLLDSAFRPVPPGLPGQLFIGGGQLARGYRNRPDLTAERFLPAPGGRMYATGDLARWLPDGTLEFLGRVDQQVKIRGFRVEPGEVEAALQEHPAVRRAVVVARDGRLAAFYTADRPVPAAELRASLERRLPEAMVPASFTHLEALPLTPNGKMDRRALPEPEEAAAVAASAAPRTPAEELVAGLFAEILGVGPVGSHDSFFDLGGHSLLATQLAARARRLFLVEVPVRQVFEAPTVAGLAAWIGTAQGLPAAPPLVPVSRNEGMPIAFAQERLWFLHQVDPGSAVYNLPYYVRLEGDLDAAALESALREIVRRHEVLRTSFPSEAGRPVQRIHPEVSFSLAVEDLSSFSGEDRSRRVAEEAARPFDLERAPLLRAALLRLGEREHLFLLSLHHIVSDAWSRRVLGQELGALYEAFRAGSASPLAPLPIQYADFAQWQRQWLRGEVLDEQISYWRQRLAGVSTLDLPLDLPRPAVQSHRGAALDFTVEAGLAADLRDLGRRHGATLFMVLLAAFQEVLHRYSGQEDVSVGTPVANRHWPEVEGLIGFFVNTLVLRTDLSGDPSFPELLVRVRQLTLEAYSHQHVPFEKLVEELQPARDLSHSPLFQVLLILQNVPEGAVSLPGLAATPLQADNGTAKFDLTLALEDTGGALAGALEYATDLFLPATAARLGDHFLSLLEGLAADPDRLLSELPLLRAAERRQILEEWNATAGEIPEGACIHHLVAQQAARTPEARALAFAGQELTYRELDERANRLAHRLRRLGVGPEARVGIHLERSLEMVVAILAVLKAGGAYVPLDPTYPRDRVARMAVDSGASVVLTQERGVPALPEMEAAVLALDSADLAMESTADPGVAVDPGNLAYVIFTSGSTGRAKGVMLTHRNAVNFFAAMDRRLAADPPGVWLAVTSISFDISVLELLWTLGRGFEVVVQPEAPRVESEPAAVTVAGTARKMDFSLFYFASADGAGDPSDKYRLLLEGARFADRNGFAAVWTPERHFHSFGGLYPNPSVVGAAIAAVTERIAIRAGSVVLPLQDPLRVAEEWSVVDNISRGRAAVSFASGWHADDFVLAPDRFARRKELMVEEIETVRRLWRGEGVTRPNGVGQPVEVSIHPAPVQAELPVWVTASGSPDTFRLAGQLRAGVLTHLLGQSVEELKEKIAVYREAWRESRIEGQPEGEGKVTLMLHTFVGDDLEEVRETVRRPFYGYLRSSLDLWRNLARTLGRAEGETLTPEEEEMLLSRAYDRYFESSALMGTPEVCLRQVERLRAAGVDEIACLVDFGVDTERTLGSLERLARVQEESRRREEARERSQADGLDELSIASQIRSRGVTHLQCTPSMARMLTLDSDAMGALGGLREMLLGGEALPAQLAEQLRGAVSGRILNMYGPTETTVWSATHEVAGRGEAVPIGRPILNTTLYVVDPNLQPVPAGVPGELYIGGEGVARGYLGRPELTAERFVPDPFGVMSGARLYRTGDRVRYRPDGTLEFLGRIDHQIKVRGHRIEPGEIEAALAEHSGVGEAVVVAREDRPGDRRLVAYVTPSTLGRPLPLRVSPEEAERLLAGRRSFRLPNGMQVAVLSEFQASLAWHEIFLAGNYLRHGIELRDGDCVFDVGGNVGFFTLFANTRRRGLKVHAFEPIPPTRATFRTNVELYGLDVELHDFGLSWREEEAEFTFYPNNSGLSGRYSEAARDRRATREIMMQGLAGQAGAPGAGLSAQEVDDLLAEQFRSERHKVRLRTLSQVLRETGVERVDLLKVDVEKAELDVVRGVADEDWARIRQVVMEVDTRENLAAIRAILERHGFQVATDEAFVSPAHDGQPEVFLAFLYATRGELVAEAGGAIEVTELSAPVLREHLRDRLPEYMLPAAFVVLDAFPLTPNGKIDRKALPAPDAGRQVGTTYEPPVDDVQRNIAAIWREVLGVDRVGIHDNFFELGGSSLLLVEVRAKLRDVLGREVSLVDLFRAPTVASLALLAAEREEEGPSYEGVRERAQKRRRVLRQRRSDAVEVDVEEEQP